MNEDPTAKQISNWWMGQGEDWESCDWKELVISLKSEREEAKSAIDNEWNGK